MIEKMEMFKKANFIGFCIGNATQELTSFFLPAKFNCQFNAL